MSGILRTFNKEMPSYIDIASKFENIKVKKETPEESLNRIFDKINRSVQK